MKMNKKNLTILSSTVLLASASCSTFAGTEVGEWYAGGSLGVTNNNTSGNDAYFNPSLCVIASFVKCSADTSDTSASIFAGYQINNYLAVEVSYTDLGNTADYNIRTPTTGATIKQDTKALSISAVGKHRIGHSRVSAFGKAGVSNWHSKAKFDAVGTSYDRETSASGTDPLLGLGLEVDVSRNATIRVGWDRYYNIGERGQPFDVNNNIIKTVDTDVDVAYVGATFSF